MRGDSGGGDAVLACAGFRDDARLAHFYGEQALADGVIDFVRAGVEQIFALEVNARAAEMRSEARSKLQGRGTACKIFQEIGELGLKACDRFLRLRRRARVRRAAPSTFREHSGRRRGRNVRERVWLTAGLNSWCGLSLLWSVQFLLGAANFFDKFLQPARDPSCRALIRRRLRRQLHRGARCESQPPTFSGVRPPAKMIRWSSDSAPGDIPIGAGSRAAKLARTRAIEQESKGIMIFVESGELKIRRRRETL